LILVAQTPTHLNYHPQVALSPPTSHFPFSPFVAAWSLPRFLFRRFNGTHEALEFIQGEDLRETRRKKNIRQKNTSSGNWILSEKNKYIYIYMYYIQIVFYMLIMIATVDGSDIR